MTIYSGTDNLEVMAQAINYNKFLQELIISHAKEKDIILDFGAGLGTFAEQLNKYHYNICCIEQDNNQSEIINRKGIKSYTHIDSIDDNSIDYIYSLNVLEHIENDFLMVSQLYKKLKVGGKLLIYVPAFQLLYSSMDKKVGHYRRYSKSSLLALLQQSNFEVVEVKYADSAGFFASLLYKFIGNKSGDLNIKTLIFYDKYIFPLSQLLDKVVSNFFGKNIYIVVEKKQIK